MVGQMLVDVGGLIGLIATVALIVFAYLIMGKNLRIIFNI